VAEVLEAPINRTLRVPQGTDLLQHNLPYINGIALRIDEANKVNTITTPVA
jgi:hypothetical protein